MEKVKETHYVLTCSVCVEVLDVTSGPAALNPLPVQRTPLPIVEAKTSTKGIRCITLHVSGA